MGTKPLVYCCHKMTGRFCDELWVEADKVCRALRNYGFEPLNPIVEEGIPNEHILLEQTDNSLLKLHWKRDKEILKQCHLVLDVQSCNNSDGVGVELGITRFCYWKPVIRIFPNMGFSISRYEYDWVVNDLYTALQVMKQQFGTKHQILWWRLKMLNKSLLTFIGLHVKFIWDLI